MYLQNPKNHVTTRAMIPLPKINEEEEKSTHRLNSQNIKLDPNLNHRIYISSYTSSTSSFDNGYVSQKSPTIEGEKNSMEEIRQQSINVAKVILEDLKYQYKEAAEEYKMQGDYTTVNGIYDIFKKDIRSLYQINLEKLKSATSEKELNKILEQLKEDSLALKKKYPEQILSIRRKEYIDKTEEKVSRLVNEAEKKLNPSLQQPIIDLIYKRSTFYLNALTNAKDIHELGNIYSDMRKKLFSIDELQAEIPPLPKDFSEEFKQKKEDYINKAKEIAEELINIINKREFHPLQKSILLKRIQESHISFDEKLSSSRNLKDLHTIRTSMEQYRQGQRESLSKMSPARYVSLPVEGLRKN